MIPREPYRLRLYVAGEAPNSALAIANLSAMCETYLADRHEIEIVDVFRQPKLALADRILITPALVKLAPPPVRSIVGTLTDMTIVFQALGLEATPI